jgi:hypothetical protein
MTTDKSALATLDETLDLYLRQKAPALPDNIKELIVQFAPWITLVVLILTLPLVLFAFGLGAIVAPLAFLAGPGFGISYGATYLLSMLIVAVSLALAAMSIPGLFKRSASGWQYAYYATLVGVVGNLIAFNVVGAIISGLIGFYVLFQIKSYYGTGQSSLPQPL